MNFFARQESARQASRWLILLFIAAAVGIAATVAVSLALLIHVLGQEEGQLALPDATWFADNVDLMMVAAVVTLVFIGLTSVVRLVRLRSGGGAVARQLGGVPVTADDRDEKRRRLYNVVEEMAIASALPVPGVYVLEGERAINAFAAGMTPANAAIAVTDGALEQLGRDELQGVIAHEFSHILNGDMRLNLRLLGVLHGILGVSTIGRILVRSSRGNRKGGALAVVGLVLYLLGYLGVFVGRIIKAAVSRQREFLADASAVQFTRQPEGIAGALRKIMDLSAGSRLTSPRTEDVSHMLFARGLRSFSGLLATHPPLRERIAAIDARFLETYAPTKVTAAPAAPAPSPAPAGAAGFAGATTDASAGTAAPGSVAGPGTGTAVDAAAVAETIGNPSPENVDAAHRLRAVMPEDLVTAAHGAATVTPLILALGLASDPRLREAQAAAVVARYGRQTADAARALAGRLEGVSETLRLPLVDMSFPALRELDRPALEYLVDTADHLAGLNGELSAFELALTSALRGRLNELSSRKRPKVKDATGSAWQVLAALALGGHETRQLAESAWQAGCRTLAQATRPRTGHLRSASRSAPLPDAPATPGELRTALYELDGLPYVDKGRVVAAMTATASHDGKVTSGEAELLRTVCAALRCPVPPLAATG